MNDRLEIRKYTLTVEGETEKWYFRWLQEQINHCPDRTCNVFIDARVQQCPRRFIKSVNAKTTPCVTHICDVESKDPDHVRKFQTILADMKDAHEQKRIEYRLGYSNYAFELWIVLHKQNCNGSLSHRRQYLDPINRAFGERFEDLDHYKCENAFNRCLSKLTLDDVKAAIRRAEGIKAANKDSQKRIIHCKGYSYFEENPSLSVHEVVRTILIECGLMNR